MRDSSKSRGGFDRALMAVAATFLTVSATSALAQSNSPRATAAELAIEAAIPRPQPANIPPALPSLPAQAANIQMQLSIVREALRRFQHFPPPGFYPTSLFIKPLPVSCFSQTFVSLPASSSAVRTASGLKSAGSAWPSSTSSDVIRSAW